MWYKKWFNGDLHTNISHITRMMLEIVMTYNSNDDGYDKVYVDVFGSRRDFIISDIRKI